VVETQPDVIVLDILMPNVDGLSACRRLRERGDRTPVLMLTARHEVSDRVAGLDAGADDYLVKPFATDELLARVRSWLDRDGRLFMHIFTHRAGAYLFDRTDREDWIAQHFLTGGVMPSHHLIRQYADLFEVEKEWRWSGAHYQRTAQDWLANFDGNREAIEVVLRDVYGDDLQLWMRRWRWFFLATAGLFGHAGGSEWGISHYRMKAA